MKMHIQPSERVYVSSAKCGVFSKSSTNDLRGVIFEKFAFMDTGRNLLCKEFAKPHFIALKN